MRYTQIKFVPMSAIRSVFNPDLGEAASVRVDGAATLICQVEAEEDVNEYLASGWELMRFITHHSAEKDATAVVAVLGKPRRQEGAPTV